MAMGVAAGPKHREQSCHCGGQGGRSSCTPSWEAHPAQVRVRWQLSLLQFPFSGANKKEKQLTNVSQVPRSEWVSGAAGRWLF